MVECRVWDRARRQMLWPPRDESDISLCNLEVPLTSVNCSRSPRNKKADVDHIFVAQIYSSILLWVQVDFVRANSALLHHDVGGL